MPEYDESVRRSYRGGFTYLPPEYKEVDVGEGLVFDVNSLYPSVMRNCPLPYDEPIFYVGEYQPDPIYNLYVQEIECAFELKEGHIPTIQIKDGINYRFVPTEYLTSSNGEPVTMWMTSVDLELFKKHYHIKYPKYTCGFKFKSTTGLFTQYIDKWTEVKIQATKDGNKAMRTLAKLMLNSLYGKFALSPKVANKYPYYEDGRIKYRIPREPETKKIAYDMRDPIYIPVGTFVTSWSRFKTISSAQKVKDIFLYADTDSLHLKLDLPPELRKMSDKELGNLTTKDLQKYGLPLPDDFEVDPVALGAWKIESRFTRARYVRQKCYLEDANPPENWGTENYDKDLLKITCAGMPKHCYPYVTWENFHEGATYKGKLLPDHVKGGIVLKEVDFTIIRA